VWWVRLRRLVLVMVALGLVGVLLVRARTGGGSDDGGAGGGGGSRGTAALLAEVHDRTAAATRLHYRWELVVAVLGAPAVAVREEGAFDRDVRRLWRAVTMVQDGETRPALRMVVDRGGLYLQPGYVASALGLAPDAWLGVGPDTIDEQAWSAGALPPAAAEVHGMLQAVTGDVDVVGHETVRGAPTTHLRAEVPGSRVDAASTVVPLDIWIDLDDRLRRIDAVMSPGVTARLELLDYDQRVVLDPPDEDAVVTNDAALLRTALANLVRG
jgi:hypothetical protein